MDLLEQLRERKAREFWTLSGAEDYYGPFPGMARASVILFRAANRQARERLVRLFMSLPLRWGAAAMLAVLLPLPAVPAGIPVPRPEPVRISPQRGYHRITPARAP